MDSDQFRLNSVHICKWRVTFKSHGGGGCRGVDIYIYISISPLPFFLWPLRVYAFVHYLVVSPFLSRLKNHFYIFTHISTHDAKIFFLVCNFSFILYIYMLNLHTKKCISWPRTLCMLDIHPTTGLYQPGISPFTLFSSSFFTFSITSIMCAVVFPSLIVTNLFFCFIY